MKVKKKWKKYVHQIALACLLICCIATCVPQTVKAEIQSDRRQSINSFSVDFVSSDKKNCVAKYTLSGSSPIYLWGNLDTNNNVLYYFMSKDKFAFKYDVYVEGKLYSSSEPTVSATGCDHFEFYTACVTFPTGKPPVTAYVMSMNKGYELHKKDPVKYDMFNSHFQGYFLNNEQIPEYIECEMGDDSEGGVNNPIEDSEIGTIEISGKAYAQDATANSDNIDEQFYTKWNWKNKTSTGFSLTKNKYHMTRIQVMVESRCLVYSDLKHKTVKEKFENYGERNKLKNGILPTDKPHTIYLKDVMSALPKTKGEFHNVLFCGYNFKYYWRVMCNDSPTGTGKWYCGGWRAVDLNQDSNKSKDINDTNNGHFDDDGNWVKDEDDGHNNTTDFSDDISGQNPDDANDTITNPKKDKADKFGWDDFKNLINECKQVPDLIKSVFSFLPDWVLVFIAIGFGIWVFVLIKRAIV